jgi:rare lipoprotein A (peptidoglycan hydrolase)
MALHPRHILAVVFTAALIAAPLAAHAAPSLPPTGPAVHSETATDTPTLRAIQLERTCTDTQAELTGIGSRLAVVSGEIARQANVLSTAQSELASAQATYDAHIVAMYESGDYDVFAILLDARSFTDFVARLELMTSVLEADTATLQEVSIVAAQAQFQSGQLDMLRSLQTTLLTEHDQLTQSYNAANSELTGLTPTLPPASQTLIQTMQAKDADYRAVWQAASVPLGAPVPTVHASVSPNKPFFVSSSFHYTTYRSTATKFTAVAGVYDSGFDGRQTASGELFNSADFTCASSTRPIGTWLAITRTDATTKAVRRIIVVVNDTGPYTDGQQMQLSRAAADALGLTTLGADTVSCQVVRPLP